MSMFESWRTGSDPIREVERAHAERVGWHLRELELRRDGEREAARGERHERSGGWLARVAQAAASWLL